MGYVMVVGNYHVRENPTSSSKSIGIAHGGDKLPYLGVNQNGWNKVDFNGETGWISGKAGVVDPRTVELLTIRAGSWNVRSGPGVNFNKLGVVRAGDQLASAGLETDGWQRVEYNGNEEAWVSKKAF